MQVSSWENTRTQRQFSWKKHMENIRKTHSPCNLPSAWAKCWRLLDKPSKVTSAQLLGLSSILQIQVDSRPWKEIILAVAPGFVFLCFLDCHHGLSSLDFDELRTFRDLHGSTVLQQPLGQTLGCRDGYFSKFSLCLLYSPHWPHTVPPPT